MGCFWGAERVFWEALGVYTTAVGYAGGYTPNPSYEETCSGSTRHTAQYRSAIYWDTDEHSQLAEASRAAYNEQLKARGYPDITTEIGPAPSSRSQSGQVSRRRPPAGS
jgi:peptide-methionine (S)-S-oxide reductase